MQFIQDDDEQFYKFKNKDRYTGELIIQIFMNTLFQTFQDLAEQEKIELKVDELQFSLKMQKNSSSQGNNLKRILDQIEIILYSTSSKIETVKINNMLQNPNYQKQLAQYLECDLACTTVLSQIQFGMFPPMKENNPIKENQLIIMFQNNQQYNQQVIQGKLNRFMKQIIEPKLTRCTDYLPISKEDFAVIKETIASYADLQKDAWIRINDLGNQINITIWKESDKINQDIYLTLKDIKEHIIKEIFPIKTSNSKIFQSDSTKLVIYFDEYRTQSQKEAYQKFITKVFKGQHYLIKTIIDDERQQRFHVEIHFKGSNYRNLKAEAKIIIQNFVFFTEKIPFAFPNLPEDDSFKNNFNTLLENKIKLPKNQIVYMSHEDQILSFFIICVDKKQQTSLIERLNNFIESLGFQQLSRKISQLFGDKTSQEICSEYQVLMVQGKLLSNNQAFNKIEKLINHQDNNNQVINQALEETIQIEEELKYITLKKSLQNKQLQNIQISFEDTNQNIKLLYFNKQDVNKLYQLINSFQRYSLVVQKGALEQLRSNQSLQDLEQKYQILFKKEKEREEKEIVIKFNQEFNQEEKQISVQEGQNLNIKYELIVVINKDFKSFFQYKYISETFLSLIQAQGSDLEDIIQNQIVNLQINDQYLYRIPMTNQFILFLANQNYYSDDGKINDQCLQEIEENIQKIFKVATEKKLKSIVLTAFGCGACEYAFWECSDKILSQVIHCLQDSKVVEKIAIIESYHNRYKQWKQVAETLLFPEYQQKPFYIWNLRNRIFESKINNFIENSYNKFQVDKSQNKVQLEKSYCEQLFTHMVDFDRRKITCMETQVAQDLSYEIKVNFLQFYLGGELIDSRLNDFLNMSLKYGLKICYINLTKHILTFSDSKIILTNQQGDQKVGKLTNNYNWDDNKLFDKFQLIDSQKNNNRYLHYYSDDQNLQNQINLEVQAILDQVSITEKVDITAMSQNQQNYFKSEISKMVTKPIAVANQQINVTIPKNKSVYLKKFLSSDQDRVAIKTLPVQDEHYELIKNQFCSDKLIQILKITNLSLQDKFKDSKAQLLDQNKEQQEIMLWLILKSQTPKSIYGRLGDGIKPIVWLWGEGAYFKKTLQYESQYLDENDCYFLAVYCQVCVNTWEKLESVVTVKENGCYCNKYETLFFLKGEFINLAYPLYEVQFQKKFQQK